MGVFVSQNTVDKHLVWQCGCICTTFAFSLLLNKPCLFEQEFLLSPITFSLHILFFTLFRHIFLGFVQQRKFRFIINPLPVLLLFYCLSTSNIVSKLYNKYWRQGQNLIYFHYNVDTNTPKAAEAMALDAVAMRRVAREKKEKAQKLKVLWEDPIIL